MRNEKFLVIFVVLLLFGVPTLYWYRFSYTLQLPFSDSQEVWGQMGDFLGGVINPFLTFINVFLLIKSVNCQLVANKGLNEQNDQNLKNEALRTFENSFFHLIECQRTVYDNFKITIIESNKNKDLFNNEAVKKLEELTEKYINEGKTIRDICNLYKAINKKYHLFDVLRSFNVLVSLIDDALNIQSGFSQEDKNRYYVRLINITGISHLILICSIVQFCDNSITERLRNNKDLNKVMKSLGLKFDLYKV